MEKENNPTRGLFFYEADAFFQTQCFFATKPLPG